MRKSGQIRPGSAKSALLGTDSPPDKVRGVKSLNEEPIISRSLVEKEASSQDAPVVHEEIRRPNRLPQHLFETTDQGLDKPVIVEKIQLYTGADFQRGRVIFLSFGLVAGFVIVGVVALVWLSLAGSPSGDTLSFLERLINPFTAILMFIVGYLFHGAIVKEGGKPGRD